mmetsp:Transcript_148729/g.262960  ORF Transcript_148729/g.262960 Transcript_148729/m.262960 type:complete len:627 (+) Transcript_148729:44-1924(+)
MAPVSDESLRSELQRFARETLHNELSAMETRLKAAMREHFHPARRTSDSESSEMHAPRTSIESIGELSEGGLWAEHPSLALGPQHQWIQRGRRMSIASSETSRGSKPSRKMNAEGYVAFRQDGASRDPSREPQDNLSAAQKAEQNFDPARRTVQFSPEDAHQSRYRQAGGSRYSFDFTSTVDILDWRNHTQRDQSSSIKPSLFSNSSTTTLVDSENEEHERTWNAYVNTRLAMTSGVAIILNVILIGIETDYMARNWVAQPPKVCGILENVFCFYFLVELVYRIYRGGFAFFQGGWNLFDTLTVALQVLEVLTSEISWAFVADYHNRLASSHVGVVRMMRVFRLIRVMRFIRILSAFSALRMMVVSIMDSVRSLVWTIVLILLAMFITSVYFTQMVTDHKVSQMDKTTVEERARMMNLEDPRLLEFYGTLDRTMLTLYQTISEGIHWDAAMEPLRVHCSAWMPVSFSLYVAFVTFAMLNVITGVFVESAIQTANEDKKKVLLDNMRSVFQDADMDNSGSITWDEFKSQLENPQLQSFLGAVDLDLREAENLFHLLDVHGRKEIDFDDFVSGAMKIHGFAKAIDLATFMHEFIRHEKRVEKGLDLLYGQLKFLEHSSSPLWASTTAP